MGGEEAQQVCKDKGSSGGVSPLVRELAKFLEMPPRTFRALPINGSPIRLALVPKPHSHSRSPGLCPLEGVINRCSIALSAVAQTLVCMNTHNVSPSLLRALWVSLVMSVICQVNLFQAVPEALGTVMQN